MIEFVRFLQKIKACVLLPLLFSLLLYVDSGYAMTQPETTEYMTIQTSYWTELTRELKLQEEELIMLQGQLSQVKRPSQQLLNELTEAQALLKKSQSELRNAKSDLAVLSNDRAELETLLTRLRGNINKERRIHRRQIWQNRFWCLLFGVGVGLAAK